MSRSEHTPGPWEWDEDGNLYPSAPRAAYKKAADEERWDDAEYVEPIAQTDGGTYGPHGADKSLIAAAPDMLAALRYFAGLQDCKETDESECSSESGPYCGKHGDNVLHGPEILAARAAIAKAEGQS